MKKTKRTLTQQYNDVKKTHPGATLLFHVGDFYEAFSEDARIVSKLLGLTLTSRGDMPMCGFPYHQLTKYIDKLSRQGLQVEIIVCD